MFTVLQRYDFESNSQRSRGNGRIYVWCLPYCKGTILKAIHNSISTMVIGEEGVYRIAKVRFWKQFTTNYDQRINDRGVFTVLQRYDFESNSQQGLVGIMSDSGVYRIAKVRFWKQFTTRLFAYAENMVVFTVLQRYDFESNSQPVCLCAEISRGVYRIAKVRFWKQFTTRLLASPLRYGCLPYCKSTILKAIHNLLRI